MSVCGYLGAGYCTTANGKTPWNCVATCQDALADCEAQVSSTTACISWAADPTKIEKHPTVTTQARKCKSEGQGRCMVFDATDNSPGANKAAAGAGAFKPGREDNAHLVENEVSAHERVGSDPHILELCAHEIRKTANTDVSATVHRSIRRAPAA